MNSKERHERRYARRKAKRDAKRRQRLEKYDNFERVASLDALYNAADEAAKGVSWKASVQRYNSTRMINTYRTHRDLIEGRDIRKGFICFDIYERGKLRHIKSVHFSERVVQKSICTNALYPILSHGLIYDNGASQKGKGTHFALNRLTKHLVKHIRRYGREGGILIVDFSDFFGRADHDTLAKIYAEAFQDERLRALGFSFIEAFGDIGLGLGSETSQINAIALPNRIDHYIKEVECVHGFDRYMDDSGVLHHDIKYLNGLLDRLTGIYAKYGIVINKKKTHVRDLKHGFTFLKTRFFITESGHIIKKPCRESITRERRKLKKQAKLVESGVMTFDQVRTSYSSWRGSMKHRDAYRTVCNMDRLFNKLFIDQWKGDTVPWQNQKPQRQPEQETKSKPKSEDTSKL